MPTTKPPSLRLHPTGQWHTVWGGKSYYFGSDQSTAHARVFTATVAPIANVEQLHPHPVMATPASPAHSPPPLSNSNRAARAAITAPATHTAQQSPSKPRAKRIG